MQYLYYKNPVVTAISPTSGPLSGYTQLLVSGENFVDLGHDSAVCVFNKTIKTNATVVSEQEILCDSPSLLNKQGYSDVPDGKTAFYKVDVSIDGGLQTSDSQAVFKYYREPKITGVTPSSGPIKGGTTMTVHGTGFADKAASRPVVRIGHLDVEPIQVTNTTMTVKTPPVGVPGTAPVAVSLNGQQYTRQPTVHSPADEHTFDYYADPYASVFYPARGPTNGGTLLSVQGHGFMMRRDHHVDRLWARFVDPASGAELAPAAEVPQEQLGADSFTWTTPAVRSAQDALLQVSLNGADWVDVKDPAADSSFTFYQAPHVTSITPSYGHVKAAKDVTVDVAGSGFECFDEDCSDLLCRFGNRPSQYIYVKG